MQVTGKHLLNSAEYILRDRRQEQKNPGGVSGSAGTQARDTVQSSGTLESRLPGLQANLSTIQNDYSREQARYTYLTRYPDQVSAELRFGEAPLFPEFKPDMNTGELPSKVSNNMEKLMSALKGVQVEMENLYALNFNAPPEAAMDAAALVQNGGLKDLDPERVARLTRS